MLFAKATQAERDEIRRACEADLLTFTAVMFRARMAQPFLINWHHEVIADKLMAVYRGEVKNLLINMPPGGTKTELAVIHFMAWCFARSPYCRFLHLSGSGELASLNSATTKEIIELEEYQALWPRVVKRDTRAKIAGTSTYMDAPQAAFTPPPPGDRSRAFAPGTSGLVFPGPSSLMIPSRPTIFGAKRSERRRTANLPAPSAAAGPVPSTRRSS